MQEKSVLSKQPREGPKLLVLDRYLIDTYDYPWNFTFGILSLTFEDRFLLTVGDL